jgi:hypothetical protein
VYSQHKKIRWPIDPLTWNFLIQFCEVGGMAIIHQEDLAKFGYWKLLSKYDDFLCFSFKIWRILGHYYQQKKKYAL